MDRLIEFAGLTKLEGISKLDALKGSLAVRTELAGKGYAVPALVDGLSARQQLLSDLMYAERMNLGDPDRRTAERKTTLEEERKQLLSEPWGEEYRR